MSRLLSPLEIKYARQKTGALIRITQRLSPPLHPVNISGGGSSQFGRASAPTMPQRVHTMRGPNVGTGT
jgi:hypothetical protein